MKKIKENKVLSKFYDYQIEAFEKVQENDKGIVIMPPGTGKTFVQAGIIADDILKNPGFRMYVINAPRIMLSYQLLKEVYDFNLDNGIDAMHMAVHSGRVGEMSKFQEKCNEKGFTHIPIENTTSPHGVSDMIKRAKDVDQPLILFSTYNSAGRIEDGRGDETINIILNDEAHYLTQERFNTDFKEIECERKYFFTGTIKVVTRNDEFGNRIEDSGVDSLGMSNVDYYGEKIYTMTPLDAISRGKIVKPRFDIITTENSMSQGDLDKSLGKLVMDSFNTHSNLLKDNMKAKMLIASSGTNDMKRLMKSEDIQNFIDEGGKFFAVASDKDVSNYINGVKTTRSLFLSKLQEAGSDLNQKLIVIHYDILTEGIDVPGLTGVLLLRNLKKSKFIQTLGRISRLDIRDRELLSSGIIQSYDLELMYKPYAWVMIPDLIVGDSDRKSNILDLIDELRSWNFNPAEDIEVSDRGRGGEADDSDPIVPNRQKQQLIGEIVEDFNHKIEEEKLANQTFSQSLNPHNEEIVSLSLSL